MKTKNRPTRGASAAQRSVAGDALRKLRASEETGGEMRRGGKIGTSRRSRVVEGSGDGGKNNGNGRNSASFRISGGGGQLSDGFTNADNNHNKLESNKLLVLVS